jgi:glycosyltransferase involved in cell wall biosynthesis
MRILALIPQLGPGGAERTMVQLAGFLSRRHEFRIMTWEGPDVTPFYPTPADTVVIRANLFGPQHGTRIGGIVARICAIRRVIRNFRPHVILSFMDATNIIALAASFRSGVPVVISERVDPQHHSIGRFKAAMRLIFYPWADRIVVQTQRVARYFPIRIRRKISVIANPVLAAEAIARPGEPDSSGRFHIVAAGRLTAQKAFDTLIDSFAAIAMRFPQWDVTIFGEGEDRRLLESKICKYNLDGRVRLPGISNQLGSELAKAHVLAFPSRYEGFPNVLAEGLAAGLPAVGFADVSGVEDLILDGRTGLLVRPAQDCASFAQALSSLMSNKHMRIRMGAEARAHVLSWAPERILPLWENVLSAAASDRPIHCA